MQDKPAYNDISLPELTQLQDNPDTVVIDVRDEWEFDEFNIGGLNIPLPAIRERKGELTRYDTLIFICTNGVRSRIAAKDALRQPELSKKTILHLNGGILETE
ncbi:rhodanese-like domain-containing protein [Arsenicibacter rosenii]|uniref:Sulfurtransferase n=1 Tax=Arsenicibacter rosenii TaxID=1750698 RepID=A0A1S2VJY1_9BACT|nr:rhodanese-like domain-containing protein [Arsenicibacter rosenii]OIN58128.1 sulfurtransferase [Arsenicibacter rosenii]